MHIEDLGQAGDLPDTDHEPEAGNCLGCGRALVTYRSGCACDECRRKYPPSLIKACCDPFAYALGLRDGTVIRFEQASICGEFASLTLHDDWMRWHMPDPPHHGLPYPCPRGVDVRIADIVWCADAPSGS